MFPINYVPFDFQLETRRSIFIMSLHPNKVKYKTINIGSIHFPFLMYCGPNFHRLIDYGHFLQRDD